jgi:hypothetical protein
MEESRDPKIYRVGWSESFRNAGSARDDELLLEAVETNQFDREEWEWWAKPPRSGVEESAEHC